MKLETIKSFLLVVLIAISLLLTFGLWSDSSGYERRMYNASYVSDVDIGGEAVRRKDVIKPEQIIFHTDDKVYAIDNPRKRLKFYKEMGNWELWHFETKQATGEIDDNNRIELIFPADIPMGLVQNLFKMNDEVMLPNWSFRKIYLTFNASTPSMRLTFVSIDGVHEATAVVNDPDVYQEVSSDLTKKKNLVPYELTTNASTPIYLSTEPIKMSQWSLSIKKIDERLFVNALFKNPSSVWKNTGEAYYSDGQRGMRISQDGRSLEFINPLQVSDDLATGTMLIERSLDNINEYKGWTGDFNLLDIDLQAESIRYQMCYDGYPVFNISGLTTIQQQWRKNELFNYRRPLLQLANTLANDSVTLPSGVDVLKAMRESGNYNMDQVTNIQPAYRLVYHDNYSSVTLVPSWYMYYSGSWQEIHLSELMDSESTGKEGAE